MDMRVPTLLCPPQAAKKTHELCFHIPHASTVPEEYLKHFVLSSKELNEEILKMTDHYTDQLFGLTLRQKLLGSLSLTTN